jgi:hypothetical protein
MTFLNKSTHHFGQTFVKDVVKSLVKPQCLWISFGTFATFSIFHLNTWKSANIKVVCLFEGHTFHNWRHLRFWVEIGEKLSQLQLLLFTRAMKDNNFAYSLCPDHWSKHKPAFVQVVEGSLIYNFAICTLVHLSSKFWRFSQSNRGKWNRRGDVAPAWTYRACMGARALPRAPGCPQRPGPSPRRPRLPRHVFQGCTHSDTLTLKLACLPSAAHATRSRAGPARVVHQRHAARASPWPGPPLHLLCFSVKAHSRPKKGPFFSSRGHAPLPSPRAPLAPLELLPPSSTLHSLPRPCNRPAPPLGPAWARTVTHCSAPPLPSPDFKPPRSPPPGSAARPHWRRSRPVAGHQSNPSWVLDPSPSFPGRTQARPRRKSGRTTAGPCHGLNCKTFVLSRGLGTKQGHMCES